MPRQAAVQLAATVAVVFCFILSTSAINPVILVPGNGGSRLEMVVNEKQTDYFYCAKHIANYSLVWVNVEYLVPLTINCLRERMMLNFDPKTKTTSNRPGVEILTPGWGETWASEYLGVLHLSRLNYYASIVDALVDHEGYERGKTIRAAPYDFRKGFAELKDYQMRLMRLIEETYKSAGGQPVILIAHSYGCLLTLQMLQLASPAWKAKYVRSFVSLDGPYFGSVVSVRMFVSGYNLNIPTLKPRWLREAQRSWPSTYLLMPDVRQWDQKALLVASPTKNYTTANLKDLFNDLKQPDGWPLYDMNHKGLDATIPPGVETFCIYGDGVQTDAWLDYRQDKGWPYEADSPTIISGDGDGTVPLRSLNGCYEWKGRQQQPVHRYVIHNAEHVAILRDPRLAQLLRDYVIDQGTPVLSSTSSSHRS